MHQQGKQRCPAASQQQQRPPSVQPGPTLRALLEHVTRPSALESLAADKGWLRCRLTVLLLLGGGRGGAALLTPLCRGRADADSRGGRCRLLAASGAASLALSAGEQPVLLGRAPALLPLELLKSVAFAACCRTASHDGPAAAGVGLAADAIDSWQVNIDWPISHCHSRTGGGRVGRRVGRCLAVASRAGTGGTLLPPLAVCLPRLLLVVAA